MNDIPVISGIDNTLGLLFDGYRFIGKRCDRYQTDVFQTRLTFAKTICFRGKDAAQVFYDTEKFSRQNAAPKRIQKTLLGEGGVQGLDGEAHRQRKSAFMTLMTPERLQALSDMTLQQWRTYAQKWESMATVILFDEVEELLTRAVCQWSGVPLAESEVSRRTRDLSLMISGAGRVGLKHLRSRQARKRAERWIADLVARIRTQQLEVPENTAMHTFAGYRDPSGTPLDERVAAVDILNVLRPTVAIGRYIVFAALALHHYPDCHQKLVEGGSEYTHWFTQEVRRFYPFFPFAAARTRHEFEWRGYRFPEDTRVLLDLYGTNRDPDLWDRPDDFWPERFAEWQENPFDFIPQGGGDYYVNHRCAGEWLTIQLMERSLSFLVNELEYRVPPQNLEFSLAEIPTVPKSRFLIDQVKRVAAA